MAKLTGQTIADSYDQLLIVGAADGISATLQAVESADTGGSSSALKIATNKIEVIPGSDDANAFEVSNAAGTAILTINSSTTSASLVQTVTTATSTPKALFIDTNTSGVAAQNSVGMHLDFDRTVAGSGTAAHNDIGIDLDVNSASLGTSSVIGMDIDVVGATGGTHTATGLTVDVGSADTNYAALFNGGNVGIGTTAPAGKLEIHSSGTSSYPFLIDSTGVDAWGMYVLEDGSSNYSIYMRDGSGNTDILLDTAGVSYFNGGNVGIGTASPNSKLSIVGAGDNESGISNNRDNYAIGLTTASTENNFANSIGWSESETDNITSAIGNVDLGTSGGPTGLWFATGTTSALAERMRIDEGGNVGIGITSPQARMDILGADNSTPALRISGDATHGHLFYDSASNGDLIYKREVSDTETEVMRWARATGFVGIGDSDPSHNFVVKGNDSANYIASFFNDGNNADRYGMRVQAGADDASGTTYYFTCTDGDGGNVGWLANTSETFALTDASDSRIKDNIRDTSVEGLTSVNQIKVRDFELKKSGNSKTGFIAQELKLIYPEAVVGSENAMEEYEVSPAVEAKEAVTRQKTVDKEVEEEVTTTEVVLEDGKYVQKTTTETVTKTVKVLQYEEVDLYDEDGEVIGKHQVPIMETVEEVVEAVEAVMGERILPMGVSRDVLIPVLVKAIQELSAKVEALENA